uniref:Asteropsin_F n=1 Tax=Asteropus TaxID=350938 RepID=A0A1A9T938_9METZ|nr:Chain A, Asteropsin_F [Asteropus]
CPGEGEECDVEFNPCCPPLTCIPGDPYGICYII